MGVDVRGSSPQYLLVMNLWTNSTRIPGLVTLLQFLSSTLGTEITAVVFLSRTITAKIVYTCGKEGSRIPTPTSAPVQCVRPTVPSHPHPPHSPTQNRSRTCPPKRRSELHVTVFTSCCPIQTEDHKQSTEAQKE